MHYLSTSIVSSIIEHTGNHNNRQNKKINSKNCLHVLYKKLLFLIFYDKTNYTEICRLTGIIYKMTVVIVVNRSYDRIRIKPSTKWNEHGNRFDAKKE